MGQVPELQGSGGESGVQEHSGRFLENLGVSLLSQSLRQICIHQRTSVPGFSDVAVFGNIRDYSIINGDVFEARADLKLVHLKALCAALADISAIKNGL